MVDFRKWFPVLALIAVMFLSALPASAQAPPPVTCTANAGVPPTVRAEGIAELVGDVLLICTGGVPSGRGELGSEPVVPKMNFTIFLNTNVTSRILAATGNWSEAFLMIDNPQPTQQRVCAELADPITPSCHFIAAEPGNPNGVNYIAPGSTVPNVFQGQQGSANSIVWNGVPFDPPGTAGTRIIRFTNVRANASQLGVSSTLVPAQVVMLISVTGSATIAINNPQQIVGFVVPGLRFSAGNIGPTQQCVSLNSFLIGGTGDDGDLTSFSGTFTEGFASAFKNRNIATTPAAPAVTAPQDVPGTSYNTETGLYNPAIGGQITRGANLAGLADTGTRLLFRVANIPNGVRLFAPSRAVGTPGGTASGLIVHLVASADANGNGGTVSTASDGGFIEIPLTGGIGGITYEVVQNNPNVTESVSIPFAFAYISNTASNLPALGTGTGNGVLAPISTVTTASTTAPLPRFVDSPTNPDIITINACSTNLLFTFVSNQAGFDTGLVISNTSQDPFGTPTQTGACTINYYGATSGGGAAPAAVTSAAVPPGGQLIWTLSTGGGISGGTTTAGLATPGFQGYIIASCAFQYAHGFAFISDLGAQRLAEGYLALVMDEAIGSRTGFVSEVLSH